MVTKCKGCGIIIQNNDPNTLGYSPKIDSKYCQRCFRLTHYDDLMISMKKDMDEDTVMKEMRQHDGLIVWVMDCFDLEAGLLQGMNRHFIGRDILVVATKIDLLPKTVGKEKLEKFILSRFKEANFKVKGLCFVAKDNKADLEDCMRLIDLMREDKAVLFMGKANAGKSTLLNGLLNQNELTVTRYPGTTLEFNPIQVNDTTYYDTPGLVNQYSLLMKVKDEDLKYVIPDKTVKPQIFQLWENQSYAIGGLCRIDIETNQETSAVFYISNRLEVHRGKIDKADDLWLKHQGEILIPSVEETFSEFKRVCFNQIDKKSDVVIHGLGWLMINKASKVTVYVPSNVEVTLRKAMI